MFRDGRVDSISRICEPEYCTDLSVVPSSDLLYFLHKVSMGRLMKELCLRWLETFVKGIIYDATLSPPRLVPHAFKYSISCLP